MFAIPLKTIHAIASDSPQAYHALVLAYPAFARALTLGDRLDFAEKFGYDCRVEHCEFISRTVWRLNGKYHRIDGPALEYAGGDKHWYANGKRHRIGGPVIERPDEYVAYQ